MENCRPYKPRSSRIPIRERNVYDVFLSFRGRDVRETLVDQLYKALSTAGLNVFLDSEKIEKGENIETSLEQAIQKSTIYIPIFSPDYSSSAWCLRELSLMWRIRSTGAPARLMIPLFYHVEPSDVRHAVAKGPYAKAFNKHRRQRRHSEGEIERWRDALYQVSSLSGWSATEPSGDNGKLVKQVVKDILKSLDFGMLDVARRPVGLIPRCKEVIQLLKLGDKASGRLTLGIWGIGGLGKTTLSKALYNEIHHLFDASCFLSIVKSEGSVQWLRKLQQQILRDLLKIQIKVNNKDHGKLLMRHHLASLQALVVLDDVDNVEQLDSLMGDWFGEGSRIIITTRDKRVLELRQVVIYPMRGLEHAEGVKLFSWHAFLRHRPERDYENMTERIVKACSGLPLALEIIGTDLYDRDNTRYWSEALRKLEKVGSEPVFKTLKISYDSLAHEVKHIFLDIACFFGNLKSGIFIQNRAFTVGFYAKFWKALGCESVYTSLKILEEKALIAVHQHIYCEATDEDIDEDDQADQYLCEFSMHEQIRKMGRQIVQEESLNDPSNHSRIWQEEDIRTLTAVTTNQENSKVEGLLCRRRMELQRIDTLAPMQKLNFLLWWKLQLKTEIQRLPTSLKFLVLSECQLKTCSPQMAGTERESDQNGSSVLSPVLPNSISQLINLQYLDMSGTKQSYLPKEVCELPCMEELYLSRCSLEALPEDFGNLIKLKTLDVSNNFLSKFPPSFQHLKSLLSLEMACNEKLVEFPALPEGLTSLNARRCSKLQVISFMYDMKSLEIMDLSDCKSVTRLPELQSCKSLRNLYVDGCMQLLRLNPLPRTVACLRISHCSQLQNFSFTRVYGERTENLERSAVCYRQEKTGGTIWSLSPYHKPEKQRLCIIGCDNIRVNIYQLLKDLQHLEQLDLSVSSEQELPGDTQPLVGQKNLTLQRSNLTETILFCFVLNRNQNVRLPQMEVVMTFLGENSDCPYFKTFKLPSCVTEDDSGEDILRVCVYKAGSSSPAMPFLGGGTISCSYSVLDQLSQCGSPVLLKQVEVLLLETDAASQIATQLLHEWKLLSSLSDIAEEEREVVSVEREATLSSSNDIGEEMEVAGMSLEDDKTEEGEVPSEREVSGIEREEREEREVSGDTFQIFTELYHEWELLSSSNGIAGERREVANIETDATSEIATRLWHEWVVLPSSSDISEESEVADTERDNAT